ncbi:arf-GAP domain and FG repeat-containing protein 1 isoform X2 [Agrilus planipennis]|uniref:Arf-GAP domain and FG repeat-containing protein 1 isoform X2 n=1 Tax=Agrilus planipennis TaxID=224129 RepID=A0A1W4XAL8_AGRPL|nr:arf-GAP domain and FG repeat-containing protein 1 isoform X2 [Agrilus planipennis]
MASSRKKQDEKNLKTLRELASLPYNKYCFDCNQRGPTYVNVTIGSFVCTKCSGMLRGLAPPHRVKSISMAAFSQEEVDFLCNRGNDYCRRTWLGLYENNTQRDLRDEQAIKDFMVDKYEKKRYYLEPSAVSVIKNTPINAAASSSQIVNKTAPDVKPLSSILPQVKPLMVNRNSKQQNIANMTRGNISRNARKETDDFVADFGSADIYNAAGSNVTVDKRNNNLTTQPSFSSSNTTDNKNNFTNSGLPTLSTANVPIQAHNIGGPPAPSEDRYAALKDLDNALKSQPTLDWNSSGSNGSLYSSSATPTSSLYSSPSPQNSLFGSPPSQGQFLNMFPQQQSVNKMSNPFNTNSIWNSDDMQTKTTNGVANPFQIEMPKVNGFTQNFPSPYISNNTQTSWNANPFMLGSMSNGHSNNPFL